MTIKRLIVNADDYGYTPGVSAGIRRAHLEGIVSSTTAMMTMPPAAAELRLAREQCPHLGIGVHLTVTKGHCLRPAGSIPSLVPASGQFPGVRELSALLERAAPGELRDEWRAQIEALLALGIQPDHLDSHHHAFYCHEKALLVTLDLAEEYALPLRTPPPPLAGRDFVQRLLQQRQPPRPDRTLFSFYKQRATLDHLRQLISSLPPGTSELMCHPAYADDALYALSSYHDLREQELAVLADPTLPALLEQCGVELGRFPEL
ncbi:MAG: ChbG/HpnK family deacetylase [Chloroflexia bacterium]|nr:ChbG/HpnK family deacetylase [Chloroflexia bacterium]